MSKQTIFQRPLWAALFAFTAAFLWGWAYPFIKLGFDEFEITADMTGSKMLFAGIRGGGKGQRADQQFVSVGLHASEHHIALCRFLHWFVA